MPCYCSSVAEGPLGLIALRLSLSLMTDLLKVPERSPSDTERPYMLCKYVHTSHYIILELRGSGDFAIAIPRTLLLALELLRPSSCLTLTPANF